MTSEIAIMNGQAAVLAADSAGTVTAWVNGREEKRYFKGENKIFQCSDHQPVGLMTFGNADLQRIPWELIIKSFRHDLGDKTFNDISDYAIELFNFINHNVDIFPHALRDQFFMSEVVKVGLKYLIAASEDNGVKTANAGQSRKDAYSEFLSKRLDTIESSSLCAPFDETDIDHALTAHANEINERLWKWLQNLRLNDIVDCDQLYELSITALLKKIYKSFSRDWDSRGRME